MLELLVLLIDKPGHRHQAEGVARVIARARPARWSGIEIGYRWWAHLSVRSVVVEAGIGSPAFWLRALYRIDVAKLARPDIVIGSGRPCVAAGILLARHFKAPFVYSGPAVGLSEARFIDRLLTNVPSRANGRNAVHTPVPNLVDPDALPPPRPLRTVDDLRGATVALMLGGNSFAYKFTAADWTEIAGMVSATHQELGVRWWVSSSRRTGDNAADRFAALAAEGSVERFVDWRKAGSGSAADLFAADAIVVTEDSISMMSEAVSARRPVVTIGPRHGKRPPQDELVETLMATGALVPLTGEASSGAFAAALLGARAIGDDMRDRIAAALAPVLDGLPRRP